jgi:hypothetical protein
LRCGREEVRSAADAPPRCANIAKTRILLRFEISLRRNELWRKNVGFHQRLRLLKYKFVGFQERDVVV